MTTITESRTLHRRTRRAVTDAVVAWAEEHPGVFHLDELEGLPVEGAGLGCNEVSAALSFLVHCYDAFEQLGAGMYRTKNLAPYKAHHRTGEMPRRHERAVTVDDRRYCPTCGFVIPLALDECEMCG